MRTRSCLFISVVIFFAGVSNIGAQYCTPTSTYGPVSGTNINKVVLEEISYEHLWVSGDPAYNDYTQYYQCQTNLRRGSAYIITLTRATYYASMRYAAWIDYNNDGDFNDAGEKLGEVAASSTIATIDLPFTVPSATAFQATRLRIRSSYTGGTTPIDPCTNSTWGETEDYLVGFTDFARITTGLDGGSGNLSFFDYDADNDYDLVVQDEYSSPSLFFCSNSAGAYSVSGFLSTPLPEPDNDNLSYTVCDLNNDNAPDLLLTYRYTNPTEFPRTLYYQKQAGYTEVATGMANLMRGSTAAADFDNDGRQDVVICGQDINHIPRTYIYKNSATGFVLINDKLHGIYGKVLAVDYDNDDDYDIFVCGTDQYGNKFTTIYRNDNNWNFTNIQVDLYKIAWPSTQSAFGDFNNDGLADLFIFDKVYRNDGNDTFTPVIIDCADFSSCRSWNDMDNDGTAELIGLDNKGIVILKYNGTDRFTVSQRIYSLKSGWDVGCTTGDFNNDRKQDIIMNYYDELFIFKNQTSVLNSAPSAPSASFRASVGSAGYYTVSLSWGSGTDDHTPVAGLSYNLRVGTTPGGNNIMSSMSSSVSPYTLMNPGPGNVGFNRSWTLRDLAPGTYYWSVQTVDKGGVASNYSAEQQFVVEPPLTSTTFDIDGSISAAGPGADFDGDGDMDLLIKYGGMSVYQQTAPLAYTPFLIGTTYDPVEIRDVNNDNLPDIIARHNRVNPPETVDSLVLFINQSNLKFKLLGLDTATFYSSASADFDNDGDIDILVHHFGYYLYKNIGGLKFIRINLGIAEVLNQLPSVSAIDIDADNDIDFIISGKKEFPSTECHTYVFRNNGGLSFSLAQELSPGLGNTTFSPRAPSYISLPPDITWNDYNSDGFPDLMITGNDSYGNKSNIIYLNDGTGNFTQTEISPRPTDKFNTSWIDFNKDGTVDIIMPKLGLQVDNSIYLNNKNVSYTPFPNILDDRTDACYIGVADVDKDLDKDIVLTYRILTPPENYKYKTTILKNTFNFANSPPAPPAKITAVIDSFTVHLSWTNGADYLMGKTGFTYNIWVGTSPASANIISPMSNLSTGYRFVEKLGNVGTNTTWTLKNLPLGTYYWGVQTIDNSLQGSSWSSMGTFELTALTADFSNDIVCTGTDTHFTDNSVSTQAITSWEWDFGGGNKSTLQNPAFQFATAGVKSVRLVVSAGALRDTLTKNVIVKPKPKVSFSAPAACGGQLTSFTNTTVFNGTTVSTWLWTFGDGNSSTDQNPAAHGFLNPGIYTATLMAVATNECSDTYTANVSVGSYPVAVITAAGSVSFCDGKTVTLSANGNPSYLYTWRLDGTLQTGATADSIVAKAGGSYTVEITNPTGNCLSVSNPVNVTVKQSPVKPEIHADNYTAGQCPGENPVKLSTQPVDGYNYMWQKDGVPLVRQTSPYISFYEPGLFRLIAEINGCTEISDVFNADFPSGPEKPVIYAEGSSAWYLACSNMDAKSYKWYYNDKLIENADKYYYMANTNLGVYKVSIGDANGCFTKSDSITIPLIYTAIDDSEKSEGLIIYPNPGKGIFNLAIENSQNGKVNIRVVNPDGRVLVNMKQEKTTYYFSTFIDLTRWPDGNYFVFIDLNGRTAARKIIKE